MILDYRKLTADYFRSSGRPLVVACGCFDLLTVGHVRHLRAAKDLGCLLVLVTADQHVNKGSNRPIFSQEVRAEMVDALRCVDYTVINPYPTAVEAIHTVLPQVYVKGREYRDSATIALLDETSAVLSVGGRLEFVDSVEMHTTEVLEKLGCK